MNPSPSRPLTHRQIAGAPQCGPPRSLGPQWTDPQKTPPKPVFDYEAPGLERIGGAGLSAMMATISPIATGTASGTIKRRCRSRGVTLSDPADLTTS